jgi:hypothetical protein
MPTRAETGSMRSRSKLCHKCESDPEVEIKLMQKSYWEKDRKEKKLMKQVRIKEDEPVL